MAAYLKRNVAAENRGDNDRGVRETVEAILADVDLEGFAGHGEQANIRVRRYGGRNVPYAGRAEPVNAAG